MIQRDPFTTRTKCAASRSDRYSVQVSVNDVIKIFALASIVGLLLGVAKGECHVHIGQ